MSHIMTPREEFLLQRLKAFIAGAAAKLGAPMFPAAGTYADVDAWILDVSARIAALDHERRLMAMLAAGTPQFSNPLTVWEAQAIRDRILAEATR